MRARWSSGESIAQARARALRAARTPGGTAPILASVRAYGYAAHLAVARTQAHRRDRRRQRAALQLGLRFARRATDALAWAAEQATDPWSALAAANAVAGAWAELGVLRSLVETGEAHPVALRHQLALVRGEADEAARAAGLQP